MRTRSVVWAAVILAAVATISCTGPAAEEVISEAVVPVLVAPAVTGPMRGRVHTTGVVSPGPAGELVVIAPDAARVTEIPYADGDRVRRGDLLVRFEIPSSAAEVQKQVAEVARAQATIANTEANRSRARELFERGIAARKEVEDADRAVADARAALAQAEAARTAATLVLARSVVRATFDGVVAKRYHNPGDVVEPVSTDPVLRVIDVTRLEVVASAPLTDSSRIVIGAAAHLANVRDGDPEVLLKVLSRSAAVEAGSATVPVRLAFVVPTNVPAGTPVQVDIDAELHEHAVLIPSPALVRDGEDTAVFVVNGNTAQRRPVKIGLSDGTQIEVVSGVNPGEVVLVDGQAGLPDEATISIADTAEPAAHAPAAEGSNK